MKLYLCLEVYYHYSRERRLTWLHHRARTGLLDLALWTLSSLGLISRRLIDWPRWLAPHVQLSLFITGGDYSRRVPREIRLLPPFQALERFSGAPSAQPTLDAVRVCSRGGAKALRLCHHLADMFVWPLRSKLDTLYLYLLAEVWDNVSFDRVWVKPKTL